MNTVTVQEADFDVGAEVAALSAGDVDAGAVASFVGLVRQDKHDGAVVAMTLEHYPGMTEQALAGIVDQARARWQIRNVRVIHRVGKLLPGERIVLGGAITDGAGAVVPDAMVEIWQAGPDGRYDSGFHGFGRCATDAAGRYRFVTLMPGPVAGPGNGTQAPHVTLTIFARGLMRGLVTRVYFAGDPRLPDDPVLALVPQARRPTLLARNAGAGEWQLDIRVQGEGETVFLEV